MTSADEPLRIAGFNRAGLGATQQKRFLHETLEEWRSAAVEQVREVVDKVMPSQASRVNFLTPEGEKLSL